VLRISQSKPFTDTSEVVTKPRIPGLVEIRRSPNVR
jgi:hypothetical protein